MSSELAEMLEEPAYWQQHIGDPPFFTFWQHHNSSRFPRVYSTFARQIFFYTDPTNRFSTDEWTPEEALLDKEDSYWPTTWQMDLVDFTSRSTFLAACDSEGRLYTWGSAPSGSLEGRHNPLGHGPNDLSLWVDSRRTTRYGPTRVFGENAELDGVRFVKCGIGSEQLDPQARLIEWTTSALTDTGVLYMSGTNRSGALGDPNASPRHYHKPLLGYTWKTYCQGPAGIIAIDNSGNAFEWGLSISAQGKSPFFYDHPTQISNGFIEELTIENAGSGSWLLSSVDPPQQAGGRQAQIQLDVNPNGSVANAWVIEPGSGYTSPPSVHFTVLGDGVAPVISCKLFSSSWRNCVSDLSRRRFALISEEGYLYTLGEWTVEPFETPVFGPARFSYAPRKHLSNKFSKVFLAGEVLVALSEDGDLYGAMSFGAAGIPGMERGKMRKIADGPFVELVSNSQAALVTDTQGRIFGIGYNSGGWLGTGDTQAVTSLSPAIGDIRATRLFPGYFGSFVALRDQTYDAAGNPVYPE